LQIIPFFFFFQNKNYITTKQLWSAGTDLLLDVHFLRIGGPVSAGMRSLIRDDGKAVFQALFSVTIQ
jgi:hypothetical protein